MVAIIFMCLERDAEARKLLRYTKTVCFLRRKGKKEKHNKLFYSTFIYDLAFIRFSFYDGPPEEAVHLYKFCVNSRVIVQRCYPKRCSRAFISP